MGGRRNAAPAIAFLANDSSSYLNGQIICLNGGSTFVR